MGQDYTQLAAKMQGAQQLAFSGVDPDWTQLAMSMGYVPNAFPAAGTEGQNEMRFMAALKNMMDQQLGGAGGRYAQMSPNNPIAAMPYGMRQMMMASSPILNSTQGRMLMPGSQADMMGGGYQFGGINATDPSWIQQALAAARGQGPAPAPYGSNATQVPGAANAGPAAELPTGGGGVPALPAPSSAITPSDSLTNPLGTGNAIPPTVTNAVATQTPNESIVSGLQSQENPKFGYDTERRGDILYARGSNSPVAHYADGMWSQSNEESNNSQRASGQGRVGAEIGNRLSDIGTAAKGIVDQINSLDTNARNTIIGLLTNR